MLLKNQPRRSQRGAFPAPLQESRSNASLQIAHLLGNCRLRNPQPFGYPTGAPCVGHFKKVTRLTDLKRVLNGRGNARLSNRAEEPVGVLTKKLQKLASIILAYCPILRNVGPKKIL